MKISIIVAIAEKLVMGKNNDIPWKLPNDLKYFAKTTKNHVVVMGRKNYESIPEKFRPLPDRTNIVITRQTNYNAPGCIIVNSFEDALEKARATGENECFIIGGAEIYKLALPIADKLYITEVMASVEGDVFFPQPDMVEWKQISFEANNKDEKHNYDYHWYVYDRINGKI